jgi:hypothetical protein
MKDWMKGPFLDISKYKDTSPATITLYPELFEQLFNDKDKYSAFLDYHDFYHSGRLSYTNVKALLENFTRCESCEQWFDQDDLIDTEQMIGGGVGHVCEDCTNTLR